MKLEPYLFYEGRCEEAIEFYKKTLGAEVEMLMRNKENPEPPPPGMLPPGAESKIMHASIRIGDTRLMMSDGHCQGNARFAGFSLTLNPSSEADAKRLFAALSDGGEVRMPLTKTFFSPAFGMLADRFGVGWMVMVDNG